MSRYRIYALIYGSILPEGKIFNCEIKRMTFDEQVHRNFRPVQSIFDENSLSEYKTYATSLPYVDALRIRSEYVAIQDIEERDPEHALGGAIKSIDRLCRFLSIVELQDLRAKHGSKIGDLSPYVYQVNKIYILDKNGNESDMEFEAKSRYIYLPNHPESNIWRDQHTAGFLKEIFEFHDEILERAVKYLYRSSIGNFISSSYEKVALDHIKSIEVIINSLSEKRQFSERLEEAGRTIGLTVEEEKEVLNLWQKRSRDSDTAHSTPYDRAEHYPNQFPIPSNVKYPGGGIFSGVATDVCLKYFHYKKNLFRVEVKINDHYSSENNDYLCVVNPQWESNRYLFISSERNEILLKTKIKEAMAKELDIEESKITINFDVSRREFLLFSCLSGVIENFCALLIDFSTHLWTKKETGLRRCKPALCAKAVSLLSRELIAKTHLVSHQKSFCLTPLSFYRDKAPISKIPPPLFPPRPQTHMPHFSVGHWGFSLTVRAET